MSQYEKLKARLMQKLAPKDIRPEELQTFLAKYGFVLQSKGGSHFTYKHEKLPNLITIQIKNPIGPAYINLIRKAIEEMEGEEQ